MIASDIDNESGTIDNLRIAIRMFNVGQIETKTDWKGVKLPSTFGFQKRL